LLLRFRSSVIARLTTFFAHRGFVQTHPPIITSSDCEGAGEVFTVSTLPQAERTKNQPIQEIAPPSFFRSPKYLTVSSQLHLEALAQSVGNVWTLSPTFRAEKSDTARHLSEFYMLEVEMAFVDELDGIMTIVEDMIKDVVLNLKNSRIGEELLHAKSTVWRNDEDSMTDELLRKRWDGVLWGPWPRITYAEAINRLQEAVQSQKADFEHPPTFADGLQAEHERFLATDVGRGSPIFVTDYPRDMKPFYMAPSADSGNNSRRPTVACFDLLVPETCELVGGSMREHRLQDLLDSMAAHGISTGAPVEVASEDSTQLPQDSTAHMSASTMVAQPSQPHGLQWYVDLRRYGSVPHGGFGLGFDRLLSFLSGVSNIRDVVSFPRWYGRCDC